MGGERPHEVERPGEPGREDACANRRVSRLHLWQPEPDVERREDEDERERIGCCDEKADDAKREQGAALARESLLRPDRRGAAGAGYARRSSRRRQARRRRSARLLAMRRSCSDGGCPPLLPQKPSAPKMRKSAPVQAQNPRRLR